MRLLIDQENMTWEDALKVVEHTFAYTNHTIMAEALERWPEDMVKTTLPRIYQILQGLNEEFCKRLWNAYPGQWERIDRRDVRCGQRRRQRRFPAARGNSEKVYLP